LSTKKQTKSPKNGWAKPKGRRPPKAKHSPAANGIPAGRVADVVKRWTERDPENEEHVAALRTGLSEKWYYNVRVGDPERLIPFDNVDQLVTLLDLSDEWPYLMGADDPDDLEERLCYHCDERVLGEVAPPHRCVWCGGKTRKAPPRRYDLGPKKVTMTVLREAREMYETPMPMSHVAQRLWRKTDYPNPMAAREAFRRAFRAMGWPIRKGPLPGAQGYKTGQVWKVGSEELMWEARALYEQGRALVDVVDIMWPRLSGYANKHSAAKALSMAWRHRGLRMHSQSFVRSGRGIKHGMYARNDTEAILADRRRHYYEGKAKCAHEGCPYWTRKGGHPTLCGRHEPAAAAVYEQAKAKRAETRGYVELGPLRPILAAWKGRRDLGGLAELSRRSGVPGYTLTRWLNRCPDDQLVRPTYASQVEAVGMPD
jgi:hypothetical protein